MLQRGRDFLERKGVEGARLEAELLVAAALGLDRMGLFLALERPVDGAEIERGRELLVRRAAREPSAYLTGRREFYGRPFAVDAAVLIPRPDTELLVDQARRWSEGRAGLTCLDVGTGSGCLAITLALELERPRVVAVDLSAEALAVARGNAEALEAAVEWIEGDGPGAAAARGPFDLVVCNPPYIEPEEAEDLAPEVRDHEPALALFAPRGRPDHWVERLLHEVPDLLAPGGLLLVELGHRQGARVGTLAEEAGWRAEILPDLEGVPRVLAAQRA